MDRRLTEEGKHFLADRVAALLNPQADYELDQHVFVVTDVETLHDDTLDRLEDSDLDNDLTTSLVLVGRLSDVVSEAFNAAGNLRGLPG